MTGLEIRPARTAEQRRLFALHEELFREEIDQIWGWNNDSQWENFLTEWAEAESFAICHSGQLIGCVQYFTRPDHLYLFNLAITPEFQNQGIGSAVITWLKIEAQSRRLAIELQALQINPRVLGFYQRQGFEITGEVETGYRLQWR